MKICFVSQEDVVRPQGGIGTYVRHMSMSLAARGHEVHAIVRQFDNAPVYEAAAGVFIHRVSAPGPTVLYSPLYFRQSRQKFLELNRHSRFDVVHGNLPLMSSWGLRAPDLPPIVENVQCTVRDQLKALSGASPLNLNPNEVLTQLLAPVLLHRERYLLRRAQRVIAVRAGIKHELVELVGCPAQKVVVIPNGIDCKRFAKEVLPERSAIREELGIGSAERIILYLGRLMKGKRVIDLVRALPLIKQRIPNVRLMIVGRLNLNAARLEQAAHQLGMATRVTFIDHAPYSDVPLYYAAADVFALPSAYEGLPFTVLEAMASGTPVVASCIPGIDEQIAPDETGLLHPVGDVEAIARQITLVLENKELAARLSVAAQRVVKQDYNWEAIAARTEQALESVVRPG